MSSPTANAARILVVEDDAPLCDALVETLRFGGFVATGVDNGAAALAALDHSEVDLVISDMQMAGLDGQQLLERIKARRPELPVVLITAYGTIDRAVAAMRAGASDYLVKPFEAEALVALATRLARRPTTDEQAPVAEDPRSRDLLELARRIARTEVTVLITGESGTGKEVFARYIHRSSPRVAGPFIAINCAAIPEQMLEAVLFGHEKGAFTGALTAHAGKFEQAQGGTLLLDEISEMSLPLQAKLLRILQEREVERIGSARTIALDVRVIATSNRQLREEVAAGRFREDLYYRLNVMPLRLPPLRDRSADVLPLAERILQRLAAPGTLALSLSEAARVALLGHSWPGNVRELDNLMQRAAVLATGMTLEPVDLIFETGDGELPRAAAALITAPGLETDLRGRERELILDALAATSGSRKLAAERLGISPRTLRHKLAQLRAAGIAVP